MEWTKKLGIGVNGRTGTDTYTLNGDVEKKVGNRKAVINDYGTFKHLLMVEVEMIADHTAWIIEKDENSHWLYDLQKKGEAWVKGELK